MDLPRWFEPSFVVPIAGMIFANSMNTVSLAGERFFIEKDRGEDYEYSRKIALETALIPQINALFAVTTCFLFFKAVSTIFLEIPSARPINSKTISILECFTISKGFL